MAEGSFKAPLKLIKLLESPVEVTMADGSRAVMLAHDTMNNPSPAHRPRPARVVAR